MLDKSVWGGGYTIIISNLKEFVSMKKKLIASSLVAALGVAAAGVALIPSDYASASYAGPEGMSCEQLKAFNAAGWDVKSYFKNKYGNNWEAKYNDRANEPYEYIHEEMNTSTGEVTKIKRSESLTEIQGSEYAVEAFDMLAATSPILGESCEANILVPAGKKEFNLSTLALSNSGTISLYSTSGNTITIEEGAEVFLGGLSPMIVESKSESSVAILNRGSLIIDNPYGGMTTVKSASKYAIITNSSLELGSNATVNGKIAYVTASEDALSNSLINKIAAASKATGISQEDLAKIQAAVDAEEEINVAVRVEGTGTEDISEEESTLIKSQVNSDGVIAGYFDVDVIVSGSVSGELGKLTELDKPASVSLTIPATYQKDADTRNWYAVRIHDGKVEKVTGSLVRVQKGDGYVWRYVVQSNEFSTYALVSEPKTEEAAAEGVGTPNSGRATREAGSIASVSAVVISVIATTLALIGARALVKSNK